MTKSVDTDASPPAQAPVNRRRWKRFKVDGAVASVPKPSLIRIRIGQGKYLKLGPVKDISMKGLAVQYVESGQPLTQNKALSVMMPGQGIVLQDLPFQTVRDFEVGQLPQSSKSIRTLCVSFKKLLPIQKAKLENFIEQYGIELK